MMTGKDYEEDWAKVTWPLRMDPWQRVIQWNNRLRKMKVGKREWTVQYFPSEKRYKVRGEFTQDEDNPNWTPQTWRLETIAHIERILWEFGT